MSYKTQLLLSFGQFSVKNLLPSAGHFIFFFCNFKNRQYISAKL
uniref:Uncharacterized protein n=1 Tax=Rhizophora mucronata TaxID=61149 RepID=A0A2P2J302_RHIMU